MAYEIDPATDQNSAAPEPGRGVTHVEVTADDAYLLESVSLSNAKIVEGFQPVMPPFKGIISDADINALVAYIKSIPDGQ